MRYERKYKLHPIHLPAVEQVLRLHPAGFREVYPARWVNNLYFDTPTFNAFAENTAGVAQRLKHRIRWYGRPYEVIQSPVLEIKIKDNQLGSKQSIRLEEEYTLQEPKELIALARTKWQREKSFRPVLFNSYYRHYWATANGQFRITIDYRMAYGPVLPGHCPALRYQEEGIVVEVKYPSELEQRSDFIFQHLPFRQTRNSKYVTGVGMVYT